MIRTFIAIDLPPGLREDLESLQSKLQKADAPVSWVKVDRVHLTLKFLGDVAPERINSFRDALAAVSGKTSPFRLKPLGCGAFPSIKQIRVVWVGLQGDDEALRKLQQEVEKAMIPFGFEPEGRPFKPHLTLGRARGKQRLHKLQDLLLANHGFEAEDFDVTELVLYKSELRPEGARYTPLFRAPFTGHPV
jgi:RNA 2',3'-cyclic 3'-phosphodiesterase